jgi:membrane associated rhomboid family serine protease
MGKDKEKRSGKKKFFLFVFFAGVIGAVVTFFKRRRGHGIEESEWQELPPSGS